jgi:hypothetical protein
MASLEQKAQLAHLRPFAPQPIKYTFASRADFLEKRLFHQIRKVAVRRTLSDSQELLIL